MKFEELTKERQEEIVNTKREINVNDDWYGYNLEGIAENIKIKTNIDIKGDDLMFDFFSKGHSGVWTDRASLFSAFTDKYPRLEDLDIYEEFGVWAYIGLRRDDVDDVGIEFYEEDEADDLTELLREKEDEEEKVKIKDDLNVVLDIFTDGYNNLYKDYDYLTSDEGIIETIKCNEMEFEDED